MKNIKTIAQKFYNKHKKLYIVGGFCRDKILGIQHSQTDVDFTTDALPEEVQQIVKCVQHVGKKYGTQIIHEAGERYEITTFRSDIGILDNRKPVDVTFTTDLKLDSKRRDFSCNAIYFDPLTEDYTDPEGGISDVKNKLLRFIGKPEDRIQEDALRILRAIRFKNKYNFCFAEDNYYKILEKNISLLQNISPERIKDEFDKILLLPNNVQALKDLKKIGFFTIFLQEIAKQSETPGNSHHLEGDVWTHTLMTIEYLNNMKNIGDDRNYRLDLLWIMLLHDIAKPICYSEDSQGSGHYYSHELLGIEIIKKDIFSQLPFSKKSQQKMAWIIKNHLLVFKIFEMKKLKARTLMMHKYWPDLMIIGEADHMGRIPANYDLIEKLKKFYGDFLTILHTKKFYTGNDVMRLFPHLTGREIGKKLNELNNQILTLDK